MHDRPSQPSARKPQSAPRLFVDQPLAAGVEFEASGDHTHYLLGVLRRNPGDPVVLFNGRDGEWAGHVAAAGRRNCTLAVTGPLRAQGKPPTLTFLFAPLKRGRLDYLVQKATELGAGRIVPVMTHHTNVDRVKTDRMRANIVEAAEQCGALWLPELAEPQALDSALDALPGDTALVFCDEAAPIADPIAALADAGSRDIAVLVGPEGGFSPAERERLRADPRAVILSLGPRILRADTAGVAALALVQAVAGDWNRRQTDPEIG